MTNLTQQPVVVEQEMSAAETLAATLHLESCMLQRIPKGSIGKCNCWRTLRAMEAFAEQVRLAERERCAKVAEQSTTDAIRLGEIDRATRIATAIRSGKEPA